MSNNKGFTLIELITAMFIGAIVFGIAFSLLLYNTNLFTRANNEVNIQYQCMKILEQLTIAAKESSDIDSAGGVYTFDDSKETTVSFDGAGNTLTIAYTVSGTPQTDTYTQISDFDITPSIKPSLREIIIVGSRLKAEQQFSTTVALRNYGDS